jgi:hypothetical protein
MMSLVWISVLILELDVAQRVSIHRHVGTNADFVKIFVGNVQQILVL